MMSFPSKAFIPRDRRLFLSCPRGRLYVSYIRYKNSYIVVLWYFLQYLTTAQPAKKGSQRGDVMASATHMPNKKTPAMTNAAMTVASETTRPFKMRGEARNRASTVAATMIYLIGLFIWLFSYKTHHEHVSYTNRSNLLFIKLEKMVGTGRLELPTSPTPRERSTRLSYVPKKMAAKAAI